MLVFVLTLPFTVLAVSGVNPGLTSEASSFDDTAPVIRTDAAPYLPSVQASTVLRNSELRAGADRTLAYNQPAASTPLAAAGAVPAPTPEAILKTPEIRETKQRLANNASFTGLSASPDGKFLAASTGVPGSDVRLWKNKDTQPKRLSVEKQYAAKDVQFGLDGSHFAALETYLPAKGETGPKARNSRIAVWTTKDLKELKPFNFVTRKAESMAWIPGQECLAAGFDYGHVEIYGLESHKIVARAEANFEEPNLQKVLAISVAADGKSLAAGYSNGAVRLYELPDANALSAATEPIPLKKVAEFRDLKQFAFSVSISPDGRQVAAACYLDQAGYLWDASGTTPRLKFEAQQVAFSADGSRLVTSGAMTASRQCVIWNVEDGAPLARCLTNGNVQITNVLFAPDGKSVIGGCRDGTIRSWNVPAKR